MIMTCYYIKLTQGSYGTQTFLYVFPILHHVTETRRTTSGSDVIDAMLEGGYENDIITTVYGPAGTGKTTQCLLACIAVCSAGKKVIYVDTEGGFSVERLRQLAGYEDSMLKNILILHPTSFEEQDKAIQNVRQMVNAKIGLIVVDTISMLYRIECGMTKDIKTTNNELGIQISILNTIARTMSIPVLLTNQVYSDFDGRDSVRMVGGDILAYSSKCLIELARIDGMRRAIVKKHRWLPENREARFEIKERGFYSSAKSS
jgi:DNA repair protein RadB